ncbi:hypothetical protein GLS40_07555 [Pseudooceanicola sp. 216_PA32_1]|uniref:Uncharacterized protein n=1 Tax=Pseudooceanicola pacificus TaxID=2676438 RepID=A0A844W485_9RHOB|nr:hypothetical protein [Pseudooceanicola pacificus]MWB77875.1 hypothetical protein [Pseudooceanicola pacificus]
MTTAAQDFQAGLIFTDETDVTIELLTGPIQVALDTFGETVRAEADVSFDRVVMIGRSFAVEAQIFDAPDADPDMLKMLTECSRDNPLVDDATRQAVSAPTSWVHVTVRALSDSDDMPRGTAQAMLAEIIHHYVEVTGAPFVQWLNRDTILRADRFINAFQPIRMRKAECNRLAALQAEGTVATPRRVRPATAPARRTTPFVASPFAGPVKAGETDATTIAAGAWVRYEDTAAETPDVEDKATSDLRSLAAVFRTEPVIFDDENGKRTPIEARLATWTVNASVAVFSPPVGAALLVYNLLRGENFRVSMHTLTLVTASIGLGVHQTMASTLAALAF